MVLIGTNFDTNGLADDWIDPDSPMLQTPYGLKEVAMYTTEPTMTVDDLRHLTMPALVLVGDDDAVRLDHTVELYTALPNAQLAVIPGASHVLVMEKPAMVASVIDEFLTNGGAVSTILPIRRR
jgi:pimeloyl-ACP methyl ester carboxylesterase